MCVCSYSVSVSYGGVSNGVCPRDSAQRVEEKTVLSRIVVRRGLASRKLSGRLLARESEFFPPRERERG